MMDVLILTGLALVVFGLVLLAFRRPRAYGLVAVALVSAALGWAVPNIVAKFDRAKSNIASIISIREEYSEESDIRRAIELAEDARNAIEDIERYAIPLFLFIPFIVLLGFIPFLVRLMKPRASLKDDT